MFGATIANTGSARHSKYVADVEDMTVRLQDGSEPPTAPTNLTRVIFILVTFPPVDVRLLCADRAEPRQQHQSHEDHGDLWPQDPGQHTCTRVWMSGHIPGSSLALTLYSAGVCDQLAGLWGRQVLGGEPGQDGDPRHGVRPAVHPGPGVPRPALLYCAGETFELQLLHPITGGYCQFYLVWCCATAYNKSQRYWSSQVHAGKSSFALCTKNDRRVVCLF